MLSNVRSKTAKYWHLCAHYFPAFMSAFISDYSFRPNSVRTKDRTWYLLGNVCIKRNWAENSVKQVFLYLFALAMILKSLYNNVCHHSVRKFKISRCSWTKLLLFSGLISRAVVNRLIKWFLKVTSGTSTKRSGSRKMGISWLTGFARSHSSLWE